MKTKLLLMAFALLFSCAGFAQDTTHRGMRNQHDTTMNRMHKTYPQKRIKKDSMRNSSHNNNGTMYDSTMRKRSGKRNMNPDSAK